MFYERIVKLIYIIISIFSKQKRIKNKAYSTWYRLLKLEIEELCYIWLKPLKLEKDWMPTGNIPVGLFENEHFNSLCTCTTVMHYCNGKLIIWIFTILTLKFCCKTTKYLLLTFLDCLLWIRNKFIKFLCR